MKDIPLFKKFVKVEPLMKGWSTDKRYIVETIDHQKLLLRLSDRSEYDKKAFEYEMMGRLAALGIPMPQPVDFGLCENGQRVYSLITWCDGEDAECVLSALPLPRASWKAISAESRPLCFSSCLLCI